MKDKAVFKKALPDLLVLVTFILISFVYFSSAIVDGRKISQHDSLAAIGQGQEARDYMARHDGERTRWTNSMFGGMPTYQMGPTYNSTKPLDAAKQAYQLFLPNYVYLVFIMMLGFYILMRALRANYLISALGAIIWAFSSYFFIIIAAGHIWKFLTLAYIPPTIAGMILIYRRKYWVGALLVMVFVAFQLSANHIQMSYYFLIVMIAIAIAYMVEAIKKKQLGIYAKSTGVLVVAGLIGVTANISSLYHTYEYSKETMRGKSELSHHGAENKTDAGLERDYITAWSYGIGETFTLLVPNTKGGASVPLSQNQIAMKKARPEYRELYTQIGQYWGDQPGTSGPVYAGALVIMLFVLGLFIVKGPLKWALLAATILSIMLSWGKNFMGLTNFFIDYVPMYNKFRTVSSILVVAEFTIPLLAALTVKELIQKPQILRDNMRPLFISVGFTAGIALLFTLFPRLFFSSFIPMSEIQALQSLPSEHIQPIMANLEEMRIAIFTADAWRTVAFILVGALILWLFIKNKLKAQYLVAALLLISLVDMWQVNKRYLNDSMFTSPTQNLKAFQTTPADETILQDTTLYYRVLNLATSTFNDGITPYWHKAIGGYHAAKLRRYQDLIDVYLAQEMSVLSNEIIETQGNLDSVSGKEFDVLNMLNTKWVIMGAQDGGTIPIENPHAFGNAWFVDSVKYVNTPDEEIDALAEVNLHTTAVVNKNEADVLKNWLVTPHDSLSTIELTDYEANKLRYKVNAKKDELAIFSEIYYPDGWQITIDGKPAQMLRVNYTLRALPIPANSKTVEFYFNPTSIKVTDGIAYAAILLMLLTAGGAVYFKLRKKKNMR
ncbi:MAG: YfhO family protein [Dysgonamonadaceae bacterium]|nr:YfhO family protein [Dysgonamonadaceae bacterium]MDD3728551.1 YfhO family protein [Dysgonamonadaceae bacterium]MDD4247335.1 YfhO family protein [Dysgonamonadaceae bacterium]MDD4606112.1 YfhO family protein [Dysgonamonadaceae bacterium]